MPTYEYSTEFKSGPDGYRREYRNGPDGHYQHEYRTGSGLDSSPLPPRPPTNLSGSSYTHSSSSNSHTIQPLPKSTVTEEYSYTTTNKGPGGSYTITKGPYIKVESNHQGPDYRRHLGPRPALGGRRQWTTTTTYNRGDIGGRPGLH